MKRTAQDILNFVEDNDVKFAKLTFCDIFGNQKNVSLFASELPRAFAEGVSFDGSSIAGFMNVEESDLVLWPDPDTATVLPWRPTAPGGCISAAQMPRCPPPCPAGFCRARC